MKIFNTLFALSLCAMLTSCATSKVTFTLDDSENPLAVASLKNGQKVEGTLKNYLRDQPSFIKIETADGKTTEYPSTEVESLTLKAKKAGEKDELWVPVTLELVNFLAKKQSDEPMFARVTYEGENVMALERPTRAANPHSPNAIGVITQRRGAGTQFFFLVKGETVAKQYWYHDNISSATHIGANTMLKKTFKDYPQVIKAIDDGRLSYKKDLTEFIRVMDKEWNNK